MEASAKTKPLTGKFEKIAYGVFVLAGIYFLLTKDYSNAVVFWGLAPIFEPFDAKIPFGKRPIYQRVWLVAHVIITLIGFVLLIANRAW
jgi:hypothetical protein